jgi:glycosyltransferase involved in cell wall biosynthesis
MMHHLIFRRNILSYNDSRIVYKKYEQNKGLVSALNSGFAICKGKYITRMDQDDVADLNRFKH